MTEIWKDINGSPGHQVSNFGRVRSFWKRHHHEWVIDYTIDRILYQRTDRLGYKTMMLNNRNYSVHRLVAEAFIPNDQDKPDVDHIDRNKSNNRVENLRWATRRENCSNKPVYKNNKSGHTGIRFIEVGNRQRWVAYWNVNQKECSKHFEKKEDAIEYRKQMVEKYYNFK